MSTPTQKRPIAVRQIACLIAATLLLLAASVSAQDDARKPVPQKAANDFGSLPPVPDDKPAKKTGIVYTKKRAFNLPVTIPERERKKLSALYLYVKAPNSDWVKYMSVAPVVDNFIFQAKGDGEHWFLVAIVDLDGRVSPSIDEAKGLPPSLKVVIDTVPPTIDVETGKGKEGELLRCMMKDENPDPTSIRIICRTSDGIEKTLEPTRSENAAVVFRIDPADGVPIRVSGQDLAQNAVSQELAPESAIKEAARKSKVRYEGKTFEEWREIFLTDISPKVREESLETLEAFARHGYAAETAAAILEIMRQNKDFIAMILEADPNTKETEAETADKLFIENCGIALKKMGVDAVPALREGLKGSHVTAQYCAGRALRAIGPSAKEAVPELLALSESKSKVSRGIAMDALAVVGQKDPRVVTLFLAALKDGDAETRKDALISMLDAPWLARETAPAIIAALRDKDAKVCEAAFLALTQADAGARAVPALIKVLQYKTVKSALVYEHLQSLGAEAREAVPFLLADLVRASKKEGQDEECVHIINTLAAIGPAAKEAVPALKKLLANFSIPPAPIAPIVSPAAFPSAPYGAYQSIASPSFNGLGEHESKIRRALDAIQPSKDKEK